MAVCCPLTRETRNLFDEKAFRHMRSHAILVNVTRGPIIDTDAMLEALDEGRLRGAGLDVTPEEPLPADSPLWDHPHVIITPHASGGSPLRLDRASTISARTWPGSPTAGRCSASSTSTRATEPGPPPSDPGVGHSPGLRSESRPTLRRSLRSSLSEAGERPD